MQIVGMDAVSFWEASARQGEQAQWEWRRSREAGRLLTEAGVIMSLPEACSLPLPQCCRQTRGSQLWIGQWAQQQSCGV